MTTNLFVIVNIKQLRTDGSFRSLLPFFRTSWAVGILNSAIFNSFHNRVEFGTILEGLRNFWGEGFELPPPLGTPLDSGIVVSLWLSLQHNGMCSIELAAPKVWQWWISKGDELGIPILTFYEGWQLISREVQVARILRYLPFAGQSREVTGRAVHNQYSIDQCSVSGSAPTRQPSFFLTVANLQWHLRCRGCAPRSYQCQHQEQHSEKQALTWHATHEFAFTFYCQNYDSWVVWIWSRDIVWPVDSGIRVTCLRIRDSIPKGRRAVSLV